MQSWGSSDWGQTFTNTVPWRVSLGNGNVELRAGNSSKTAKLEEIQGVLVTPGMIWAAVRIRIAGAREITLDGIPNHHALDMAHVIEVEQTKEAKNKILRERLPQLVKSVLEWQSDLAGWQFLHALSQRWTTYEEIQDFLTRKSKVPGAEEFNRIYDDAAAQAYIKKLPANEPLRVAAWKQDLWALRRAQNETYLKVELKASRPFFDSVEKTPLTDEQALAVLCFENRLQIIASAGSGKTSTMVAKAGYALHKKIVQPEEILLLAFNADAAAELAERISERLTPLGLPADKVVAKTFHSFGLEVIGNATGKKPRLASWLERGGDVRRVSDIVRSLSSKDPKFRKNWELFRDVFQRDLPASGVASEHEDVDKDSRKTGFRTKDGKIVKSREEQFICDWLYRNGVEYVYERPYEVDTATSTHGQYQPDFYYPKAKAYHEHFALDEDGKPPKEFKNYLAGVKWKRELHAQHGTTLWETTSATLKKDWLEEIEAKLVAAGVQLDPQDRSPKEQVAIDDLALVKTMRTFLTHAKSNCLSDSELWARLAQAEKGAFAYRHRMFLQLFVGIRTEWERLLREEQVIDFDDMLNQAAEALEAGRWKSPYRLVLVDEFQDASHARARMTKALVADRGRFLCAVGDDWQSINRFAGADLSVMTDFEQWFGKGETMRLERTFRSPQSLTNISSQFVLKNPRQLKKKVASSQPEFAPTIRAFVAADEAKLRGAIQEQLHALRMKLDDGSVQPGRNGRASVYLLGRYRSDEEFYVPGWQQMFGHRMDISFMTIHGSKGLEADYVILPRITGGKYGFPSTIEDDPVLQIAMPKGEEFPLAEERRLFYVALTRARRSVLLFTVRHKLSPFLTELVRDHKIEVVDSEGQAVQAHPCPKCGQGQMVPRSGKHGKFWACNRFPACKSTANTLKDASGKVVYP